MPETAELMSDAEGQYVVLPVGYEFDVECVKIWREGQRVFLQAYAGDIVVPTDDPRQI